MFAIDRHFLGGNTVTPRLDLLVGWVTANLDPLTAAATLAADGILSRSIRT